MGTLRLTGISMTPAELTTFITAIANITAADRDADQLTLLAIMLTQLADTLATIAFVKEQSTPEIKESVLTDLHSVPQNS